MKDFLPLLTKLLKWLLPLLTGAAGGALTGCATTFNSFF